MTGKISDSPSLPTRLGRRPAKELLSCTVRLRLMVSLPLEGFPRPAAIDNRRSLASAKYYYRII
jgi:hypothetical protein